MSQKDLFDDTTMTFGEHLEALRVHLWKAVIGLVIGTTAAFFFSNYVIVAVQKPVVRAMMKHFGHEQKVRDSAKNLEADQRTSFQRLKDWWSSTKPPTASEETPEPDTGSTTEPKLLTIEIPVGLVMQALHNAAPESYPAPPKNLPTDKIVVSLADSSVERALTDLHEESMKPRTDGPDEAFMIYMKVSLVLGIVLSSPWIFYQIWLFVAAGLYQNERKYVYTYLPLSIGLFVGGACFCFFAVIPFVLDFLFSFNTWLELRPELKIGTWISFALMVSLMFGVSFQLPLVMLFLERISILSVNLYREKRRYAILAIAFISMVLTPSDPVSMMLMMVPLCILYELGILLCGQGGEKKSPFQAQTT